MFTNVSGFRIYREIHCDDNGLPYDKFALQYKRKGIGKGWYTLHKFIYRGEAENAKKKWEEVLELI